MASLPFKHPRGCTYALYEDILLEDRGRQDYGNLDALRESIKEYGLIHPPMAIALEPPIDGKRYRLIAGGRRTMAMLGLKPSHIPINVRNDLSAAALDKGKLFELELEENIQRKDMTWVEECLLIYRAHIYHAAAAIELKTTWGSAQTGHLFGKSSAHVSHALLIAQAINDGDQELSQCNSISGAYKVLLARKEQEADSILSKQALSKQVDKNIKLQAAALKAPANISPTPPGTGISLVPDTDLTDIDSIINGDMPAALMSGAAPSLPTGNSTFFDGLTDFPLSEWLTLGDSVSTIMPSWPAESVDHIITDPPYGIDINEEHLVNAKEIAHTHDRDENLAMFPDMLKQFYRILKPRGYCIFFIDIEHVTLLKDLARSVGFSVQNHLVTWVKTHQCKNLSPKTNFTNTTEHALVCRKGTSTLEMVGPPNVIIADGSVDRRLYSNPFAKPFSVWQHFITAVSRPGDIIADPFAGQCSGPRACLNLGRIPKACEVDPVHYNKGVTILADLIKELAGKDVNIH